MLSFCHLDKVFKYANVLSDTTIPERATMLAQYLTSGVREQWWVEN